MLCYVNILYLIIKNVMNRIVTYTCLKKSRNKIGRDLIIINIKLNRKNV